MLCSVLDSLSKDVKVRSINRIFILWIVNCLVFLFSACGGSGTSPPQDPPSRDRCDSKVVSQDECFYPLPSAPPGQIFNGSYKEALHIHTKGVTVGKGQWRCNTGSWEPVYQHICLTCLPGRSVEHCQNSLNKLITKP